MCCGRALPKKIPSLQANTISKTQYISISVTSLWFCSLCKSDFLLNSSLHWTWEKWILLAHKSWTRIRSNGDTLRMGGKWKLPWNMLEVCCQCVCCSFGAAFFLLFSRKYFSLLFFILLFFCGEWQRKRKCGHVLRDLFVSTHHSSHWKWRSYGHSCVPHSLGLSDLVPGQSSVSALFQSHLPFSARISSDVKRMGLLPVFCSERDLFHMVNLTTAVWVFSPPTKHPWWLGLESLSCSNNNFWSFFNLWFVGPKFR